MLSDRGKELLKPWISVQNFVLAFAVIFFIALFDLSSSELASWVQAIGSITAIAAAVLISSSQRREQINAEKLRVELQLEMINTLAQRADRAVPFGSTAAINLQSSKNIIIGLRFSFEAINLVSLPDASLVEPICTIRDALRAIEAGIAASERSGQFAVYSSSAEFFVWVALVKASSKAITSLPSGRQA